MSKPRTWRIEFNLRGNDSAGAGTAVSKPRTWRMDIAVVLLLACLAANNAGQINAGVFLFACAIAGAISGHRQLRAESQERDSD